MLQGYIYSGNNSDVIREGVLKRDYMRLVKNLKTSNVMYSFQRSNFIWVTFNLSQQNYKDIDQLIYQKKLDPSKLIINQLQGINQLVSKDGIFNCLQKYYRSIYLKSKGSGESGGLSKNFNVLSYSFVVQGGSQQLQDEDLQMQLFKKKFKQLQQQDYSGFNIPHKHLTRNQWIIKPVYMNRGRGIQVFKNLKDIRQYLLEKQNKAQYILQKYIEKPLLYKGRKFDI